MYMFFKMGSAMVGLFPFKFTCWGLNPSCNGVWRWSLIKSNQLMRTLPSWMDGEGLVIVIVGCYKSSSALSCSLALILSCPSAFHYGMKLYEGLYQQWVSYSCTSQLPEPGDKYIPVLYKLLSLIYSVLAVANRVTQSPNCLSSTSPSILYKMNAPTLSISLIVLLSSAAAMSLLWSTQRTSSEPNLDYLSVSFK